MPAQDGEAGPLMFDRYVYDAECVKVVDGDTLKLDVDLGLDCRRAITIRVHGINTPEMRGPEREEGIVSRNCLKGFIDNSGGELIIQTVRDRTGKYGRYVARIFNSDGLDLGEELVRLGMAERVNYG